MSCSRPTNTTLYRTRNITAAAATPRYTTTRHLGLIYQATAVGRRREIAAGKYLGSSILPISAEVLSLEALKKKEEKSQCTAKRSNA